MSQPIDISCTARILRIKILVSEIREYSSTYILEHDCLPIENTYDPNYFKYEMMISLLRRLNEEIKSFDEANIYF